MPTFGSLLVIIGDSLLNTRLYGGAGEPEDSPYGAHKKRAPDGALLLNQSPHTCGEGACSRWIAKRSQYLQPRSFRENASAGFATAAQSSGSKLPRHKGP